MWLVHLICSIFLACYALGSWDSIYQDMLHYKTTVCSYDMKQHETPRVPNYCSFMLWLLITRNDLFYHGAHGVSNLKCFYNWPTGITATLCLKTTDVCNPQLARYP